MQPLFRFIEICFRIADFPAFCLTQTWSLLYIWVRDSENSWFGKAKENLFCQQKIDQVSKLSSCMITILLVLLLTHKTQPVCPFQGTVWTMVAIN